MRAIDADALKRDFRQTFVDGEQIDVREVIERIELLAPTLGPVIVWTPVEKGYPTAEDIYLITDRNGVTDCAGWYNDSNWHGVIAWSPLPAPYKAVTP